MRGVIQAAVTDATLLLHSKVRISLGLKPLQPDPDDKGGKKESGQARKANDDDDDDDPLKNQDEKAAKNYAKYQDDMRRKREEEEIRERIARCVEETSCMLSVTDLFLCRAQNKRELNRKLRGPTLGDADATQSTSAAAGDSSKDTLRWVKAAKKKAKENAARRLKAETEAEELASASAARYDSEDLTGLRVAHDMDEIDLEAGGEGRVLTLKDSKILEGGDDELLDSALEAAEKDKINAERKKGVKKYTGLDDDDFEASQVGKKRGVLSKYDNDIEEGAINVKRDDGGFTLGGQVSRAEKKETDAQQNGQMRNRTLLDLDYTKNVEVSDYLQEGDVGFKKPRTKKKKRAPARVRLEDDEDEAPAAAPTNGDVEMAEEPAQGTSAYAPRRQVHSTETVVDDDDLALSLAKARREKAKKVFKKMTPEMIAANLAAQREADEAEGLAAVNGNAMDIEADGEQAEDGVSGEQKAGDAELVFDDTSEFVRNINEARQVSPESSARLQRRAAAAAASEATRRQREAQNEAEKRSQVKQEPSSPSDLDGHAVDADALLQTTVKDEESDEEMEEGYARSEGPVDGAERAEEEEEESAIEPLVSGGMAAALSLLRKQGLITEVTPEQKEREKKQKEYDAWLATRRLQDRVREAELAASKAQGSSKDQATREYENKMREVEDARLALEKFKNYSPDIEIKYTDEFGRTLNHHEAWKRLSHTFHGKQPGQKKQEQRIQRIMDERKREKMLAGDTPSGMTKAFTERAERSGQAHMVLGVGSKNNAPQDIGLLGPNTVSRPKEKAKAKGVSTNGATASDKTLSNAIETGMESSITGITSMVPRSTTTKSKAGFAPVKNSFNATPRPELSTSPTPDTQTPPPPSKFKLAFNKRPAPDQTSMAPPPPTKHIKMEDAE
jgi:U4/U6.U5 tri-snRNP-associated protein 1